MNYRFRQIAVGFARETNWSDSSGTIRALRANQAAHALQALLEDYPRQASAVSFNLVDSHDTNRVLHVLTEPGDTLALAKERQRLVAFLQFTCVRRADDLLRRRDRDQRAGEKAASGTRTTVRRIRGRTPAAMYPLMVRRTRG